MKGSTLSGVNFDDVTVQFLARMDGFKKETHLGLVQCEHHGVPSWLELGRISQSRGHIHNLKIPEPLALSDVRPSPPQI
jgi:hypothetical protein